MIEIRRKANVQRNVGDGWQEIGGQVLLVVEGDTLEGADLSEKKLRFADLKAANLRGTNFTHTALDNSDLSYADLTNACLQGALLPGVSFRKAVLDRAEFSSAWLAGTHLEGVDLRKARLSGAKLRGCYFDEATQWPDGFDPWEQGAGPSLDLERSVRKKLASGLTPEEYAGRHGHTILIFGFTHHLFRDPQLTRWTRRLGAILRDPQLLAECQEKYLSPEELEEIRRAEAEELK